MKFPEKTFAFITAHSFP